MRWRAGLLPIIAMLAWTGAATGEPFIVDGTALELPAPDGFCYMPTVPADDPRNADIARRQPPDAEVIAMVEPCAEGDERLSMAYGRWLLLLDHGQPRRLTEGSTRSSFLKSSIDGRPVLVPGTVFQLGFLSPNLVSGVIGHDTAANYRALVYPVSSPLGGSLTQAGIEGETVLQGRIIAFQMFATYGGDDTYESLEAQVRAVMARTVRSDAAGTAPRRPTAARQELPSYIPPLEVMEALWLLGKALLIAAAAFAASLYLFRRRSGGRP